MAGHELDLSGHSAANWIMAMASQDPEEILPGLLSTEDVAKWELIYFGDRFVLTSQMHREIALAAFEAASGFGLAIAMRLVATASGNWHRFQGWYTSQGGLEVLGLPLDAFCDLTYFFLTQYAEEKDLIRIDAELLRPLPGTSTRKPPKGWDEASTAMAALAAHQATKRTATRG